ncbi:hypothetical protein M0D21_14860 [Aquimarina sp. D1M17]|uniref:hypothetical protein n=1 Tax=Aquimarina acroporae TaxID=2937283 RepID=UPI0020C14523|nr:hypothetical protein [Aquimarina acroporae]MCK8522856.1 hypothetical protein [Aquimarina acroporae]
MKKSVLHTIHQKFLVSRSLISAIAYSALLYSVTLGKESALTPLLYLEIYNMTLLYIIINMLLFAKDIMQPDLNSLLSKDLINILLNILSSAILIISLFAIRSNLSTQSTGIILIKVNALFITCISTYISVKISSKPQICKK